MTVKTLSQTVLVSDPSDVVVTEIADGTDAEGSPVKVREIRIFGPDGTDHPAVLTVRLEAETAEPIRIDV